jgi:C4-dicarboxylate-specific signal transduction histidine kinase
MVLLLLENDLRQCVIALDLDLDESLFPLLADGIQIQQVLVNLIRNAIDAMNRPEVSVRQLAIRTSATPDGARVGVADTGGRVPILRFFKIPAAETVARLGRGNVVRFSAIALIQANGDLAF